MQSDRLQGGNFGHSDVEVRARTEMSTRFLNQVYAWMAGGLALSGAVATALFSSEQWLLTVASWMWPLVILELVVVMAFSAMLPRMSAAVAAATFLFYAALNGVTLAPLLLVYTSQSVAQVFFVTAGTFAAMAVYGATTKRDLTSMGSFMVMGLWAIVIAGIVNIFMRSSALGFAVSLLGAVIFIGLTAYDVQKFKALGYMGFRDGAERRKAALVGALHLYLDFVNLFLSLLRLFGNRR
jgi:FtsH-binding integral membrane protein